MLQKKDIKEEEIHLRDYVRVMLRRVWIVIISFKATPNYQTTTLVMIDRENLNDISFEDVSHNYSEPFVFPNMSVRD